MNDWKIEQGNEHCFDQQQGFVTSIENFVEKKVTWHTSKFTKF